MYLRFILLLTIVLASCTENTPEITEEKYIIDGTNLKMLSELVSLPKQPYEARWRTSSRLDSLLAVMHFNEEDYRYIIENSQILEENNAIVMKRFIDETPLFQALHTKLELAEFMDNFYTIANAQTYQSDIFTQGRKSFLVSGDFIALGDGYIFLFLGSLNH